MAHPGRVTDQTALDLRATAVESARQTRAVLAEITDPDGELTASAATRHRLDWAALALEGLADQPAPAEAAARR